MEEKERDNKTIVILLVLLIISALFFMIAMYWAKSHEKAMQEKTMEQLKKELRENSDVLKLKYLLQETKETKVTEKENLRQSTNTKKTTVNIKELAPLMDYVKTDEFWNKTTLTQKFEVIKNLSKFTRVFFPALPQDIIELKLKSYLLLEGEKHYGKGYAEYREFIKKTTPQLLISAIEGKMGLFEKTAGFRKFWEDYSAEKIESKASNIVDEYRKTYMEVFGKDPDTTGKLKESFMKLLVLKGYKVAKDTDSFKKLASKYLPELLKKDENENKSIEKR